MNGSGKQVGIPVGIPVGIQWAMGCWRHPLSRDLLSIFR